MSLPRFARPLDPPVASAGAAPLRRARSDARPADVGLPAPLAAAYLDALRRASEIHRGGAPH